MLKKNFYKYTLTDLKKSIRVYFTINTSILQLL